MRLVFLPSLAILTFLGTGNALGADDIGAAVNSCRAVADDAQRLACYDRAVGRSTGGAPAAAAKPEDSFGRERELAYAEDQKRAEATRAVGELQSTLVGLEKRMDGLMTFTLDNGQVWRQIRPDSLFSIKQGDAIRIQPGSLGSFILSGPTKKSTRVTRVK